MAQATSTCNQRNIEKDNDKGELTEVRTAQNSFKYEMRRKNNCRLVVWSSGDNELMSICN